MDDSAIDESEPPLKRSHHRRTSSLPDLESQRPAQVSTPPTAAPLFSLPARSTYPTNVDHVIRPADNGAEHNVPANEASSLPPPAPPPANLSASDEKSPPLGPGQKPKLASRLASGSKRFLIHTKDAILHSWINVLLIFVPIGIALEYAPLPSKAKPTIVFSMNAIAIVPLAGLLAYATETVASRLGDTLASLLNVTFGNAVELIIFIIALSKDQIRITQASILGSILANLLLILGMSFLLGGLRFQEQIYNNTVTQMSAVLLSLSVMSLLLPTAFHASFVDNAEADSATTKISRGVSVVLLIVYILYLLFQLKSHAYMYASTPQQVIDEESHPGVLADILNSSSDSESSSSDSDSSSTSRITTKKRIKRAVKKRIRRKSGGTESTSEITTNSTLASPTSVLSSSHGEKTSLFGDPPPERGSEYFDQSAATHHATSGIHHDEMATEQRATPRNSGPGQGSTSTSQRRLSKASSDHKATKKGARYKAGARIKGSLKLKPSDKVHPVRQEQHPNQPRVFFSDEVEEAQSEVPEHVEVPANRRAFSRTISRGTFRGTPHLPLPRLLSNTVFTQPAPQRITGAPASTTQSNSLSLAHRPGPRRTTSLPDRIGRPLNPRAASNSGPSGLMTASSINTVGGLPGNAAEAQMRDGDEKKEMSNTAAVVLLLVTTGLVAFCAELLVEAIPEMVSDTSVSEAFIGLIILPIVGNAAEHVTAVTVAAKNKMDLAIGVAVGSSIQIALFITPLVVLLGWFMSKEMSLYFNLFETVSLFVTVFVINFLILDGRSNYLEGSLLIAAYVIIALSAFFYPQSSQQSELGGSPDRSLTHYGRPQLRF